MNRSTTVFILALALTFGAMAPVVCANAQERLRVAWAGGASNAAVWIVQDKGLMKKQGVNAEFISVNASPMALQAMIAGEFALDRRGRGHDRLDRPHIPRAHRHAEKRHRHKTTQGQDRRRRPRRHNHGDRHAAWTEPAGDRAQHGCDTCTRGRYGRCACSAFKGTRAIFDFGRTVRSRSRKTWLQVPGRYRLAEHPVSLERSAHSGSNDPVKGSIDGEVYPVLSRSHSHLQNG